MCTFNGERYLREQLDSFMSQERRPDELVICDDASDDRTVAVVESWAQDVPFAVQVHINPQRLGSTANFDKAIGLCTGELIALADQDDVWLDHKLAEAESAFEREPALGCWFTDALLVDENLQQLPGTLWQSVDFDDHWQDKLAKPQRLAAMLRRSFVTGATMVFAARHKPLVLPIPQNLPFFIHDRWIATLIAAVDDLDFSARPSMLYRQHGRQQIGAEEQRGFAEEVGRRIPRPRRHFEDDLTIARAIAERLGGNGTPEARGALDERLSLLKMRLGLPENRLMRVGPIARGLWRGEYSRHAEGLASAAKDFLLR
jgi:glycosyltransferase involved in cell wall biosynthesis